MDSWPNQEALNRALNIYRTYMRAFIVFHLKKIPGEKVKDVVIDSMNKAKQYNRVDEIKRVLRQSDRDIESIIDINDFPHLVNRNWRVAFETPLNDDKTFGNQLWLIVGCRNEDWAHPPEGDAELEGTRAHLFLIADVLGKINRPDKQREVEIIRDALDNTKERLAETEKRLEAAEAENAKYKKSLAEEEKRSETAEAEKNKYEKHNTRLSGEVDQKEKRLKKLSQQLKRAKTERDKHKNNLSDAKQRIKKSEEAQADSKKNLKDALKELKEAKVEKKKSEERHATVSDQLTAMQAAKSDFEGFLATTKSLLITATIGHQEVQAVFPPLGTDSTVRILDRRGIDKRNYLLELLEQKQPTIIYVQNEEKIERLLEFVEPEKEGIIGRHNEQTSDAEEAEILEKLARGELIAIVSSSTISTPLETHCVEHFVFCHLTPDLDAFYERCQPIFTSAKNTYLHLIHESKQDVEELLEKYLDEEALRKLYKKFSDHTPINGQCIDPDSLYNELCKENELSLTRVGIETGLSIFEELGFLEQNEEGIKRLSATQTELEESKTYCRGEKLKKETANCPAFQYERSVDQMWEEILKKLNVDNEQILPKNNVHKISSKVTEIGNAAVGAEQYKTTPSTVDVWPQRDLRAFDSLRQRAAKRGNNTHFVRLREDDGRVDSPFDSYELEAAVFEQAEDYRNKYDLAIQFVQKHGVGTLKRGVAQLIKDRDDPDYDFTDDETSILRAFQDALRDFQAQSDPTEKVKSESTVDNETVEARHTPKPPRANAKVTKEQVREIRSRSAAGESHNKLAKEFDIASATIRNIVQRKTWKDVE